MDFTSDVIISVFLIVVIAGFVITFITQTFHIFRKMLAVWIRRRRKVSFLGVGARRRLAFVRAWDERCREWGSFHAAVSSCAYLSVLCIHSIWHDCIVGE
jgi:hypothetical protein